MHTSSLSPSIRIRVYEIEQLCIQVRVLQEQGDAAHIRQQLFM